MTPRELDAPQLGGVVPDPEQDRLELREVTLAGALRQRWSAAAVRTEGRLSIPVGDGVASGTVAGAGPAPPEAGIASWSDIERLDVRPSKGIVKVRAVSNWEVQIDTATGEVLQVAYRRSDLIESIHDGSWFHERAKLFVFLPAAVVLLGLWGSGVYLFLLPYLAKRRKRAAAVITCAGERVSCSPGSLKTEAAKHTARGTQPVIPRPLASPPITPSTAVPWRRQRRSSDETPVIRPPECSRRSSWSKDQPPSTSTTRTWLPMPPACCQAKRRSSPSGAGSR